MSGIAGILRRDGKPIPKRWAKLLDEAIALRGQGGVWRFEDATNVLSGSLKILLISSQSTSEPVSEVVLVVDGELGGECAAAMWDVASMELQLVRRGSGQKPLYMLDLGEAGDGVVFCSIPTPLYVIARDLDLVGDVSIVAMQQFLQLGFVTGDQSLLHPVQSVPLETMQCEVPAGSSSTDITFDLSPSPSEDVHALVSHMGQPFADTSLLSRVALYRGARLHAPMYRHCIDHNDQRPKQLLNIVRWHWLLSLLPNQTASKDFTRFGITTIDTVNTASIIEKMTDYDLVTPFCPRYSGSIKEQLDRFDTEHRIPDCTLRGIDAAAMTTRLDVRIDSSYAPRPLENIPLGTWFKSDQSGLGELAGDLFSSMDTFDTAPIDREYVFGMFDDHRNEKGDFTQPLFTLLTLGLWLRQVAKL